MVNRYMKRYSKSLVIREMQVKTIKTTKKWSSHPLKSYNLKRAIVCEKLKLGSSHSAGGNAKCAATLESSLAVPPKVNVELVPT